MNVSEAIDYKKRTEVKIRQFIKDELRAMEEDTGFTPNSIDVEFLDHRPIGTNGERCQVSGVTIGIDI